MQRPEVSGAVRHILMSLGGKGLKELTTAESILKLSVDNNFNYRFN
jgi:hypothetical protein